jgi:HD-like signal output (HDOD) protein
MFNRKRLRAIWNRSLEAAQICERLAVCSGDSSRNEAFLAGLMHDIGSLLISQMSETIQQEYESLVQNGCPLTQVEQVLFGVTHAEIGAHVLRHWKLNEAIVTAVGHHHRVSRSSSRLTGLLYLTEFCCGSEEALPSSVRLASPLELCRLDFGEIAFMRSETRHPIDSLRFVA